MSFGNSPEEGEGLVPGQAGHPSQSDFPRPAVFGHSLTLGYGPGDTLARGQRADMGGHLHRYLSIMGTG